MVDHNWNAGKKRQIRRLFLTAVASFLFFGVVTVALMGMWATNGPFSPGDFLFFAQAEAEQWNIFFSPDPAARVESSLIYLHRRADDLVERLGSEDETTAFFQFEKALDQTIDLISYLPDNLQHEYQQELASIVAQSVLFLTEQKAVLSVTAVEFTGELKALQTALAQNSGPILIASTGDSNSFSAPEMTQNLAEEENAGDEIEESALEEIVAVPFLDQDIDHSFFPLSGGHALQCESCHVTGDYQGTPNLCIACHDGDDAHAGNYGDECSLCHQATVWEAAQFNHVIIGTTDCAACHAPPANHFAGACSACHSDTANFRNAVFNHSTIGATDCGACHAPPANHFAGACSACHSDTANFRNAVFNHSTIGATDCAACHAPPANHFAGTCSACHFDTANFRNAVFNHSTIGATDCAACHGPPANHFAGACSACHSDTANFRNAVFNHSTIGATDCAACHGPPANHFAGACSACHSDTANFRNASFNHSTIGATDCGACHGPPANHYGGTCSACHKDTGNFRNAVFNHSTIGATDCGACHGPPANHFAGACSACHSDTANFRNASFNHSTIGATDCVSCHAPPANHYGGTCSACHKDTGNFRNASFNHSTIGATDCVSCHSPPPNHFSGTCRDCHTDTGNFGNASFNHRFPINHEGANGDCATCHPGGNTASYTCTNCHEHRQSEVDKDHDEVNGYPAPCASCHPDGDD